MATPGPPTFDDGQAPHATAHTGPHTTRHDPPHPNGWGTDALVALLAADSQVARAFSPWTAMARAWAPAAIAAIAALVALWGLRPELLGQPGMGGGGLDVGFPSSWTVDANGGWPTGQGHTAAHAHGGGGAGVAPTANPIADALWTTAGKAALPLLWAALGLWAAVAAMRPEGNPRRHLPWAGAIVLLAAGWWGYAWIGTPTDRVAMDIQGKSLIACLLSIPLLALPMIGAGLLALRRGAPIQPAQAGLWVGLGAGGMAAAVYALHCTDDAALFHMTWYSTGILATGLLGGVLGTRFLHW